MWPQIKAEDVKALNAFSLFLVSCHNAMEDTDYMEEMNNPTNMRVIISKLPFKMRERRTVHAFDLQELRKRRARFADLVNFVDRQAKISSDPRFGDLNTATAEKKDTKKFQQGIKAKKGSSFATNIELIGDKQSGLSRPKNDAASFNGAFMKLCVFCGKNHTLENCQRIREQPHKERVKFRKKNGFCFGCLV